MTKLIDRTHGDQRGLALYELQTARILHTRAACTLKVADGQRGLAEVALFEGRDSSLWKRLRDFEDALRAEAAELTEKAKNAELQALLFTEALAADLAVLDRGQSDEPAVVQTHHRIEAMALVYATEAEHVAGLESA
jgi:hypothetical protein